jgi:putative hemolysin
MIVSLLVLLLIICIVFSALFSATETGILSINRIRLRHMVEKGEARARLVDRALKSGNYVLWGDW